MDCFWTAEFLILSLWINLLHSFVSFLLGGDVLRAGKSGAGESLRGGETLQKRKVEKSASFPSQFHLAAANNATPLWVYIWSLYIIKCENKRNTFEREHHALSSCKGLTLVINSIFQCHYLDFLPQCLFLAQCNKCLLSGCQGSSQARKNNGHVRMAEAQKLSCFTSRVLVPGNHVIPGPFGDTGIQRAMDDFSFVLGLGRPHWVVKAARTHTCTCVCTRTHTCTHRCLPMKTR